MISNYFNKAMRQSANIHPALAKWWPLPMGILEELHEYHERFGEPSRLFKYKDYCAVHYTFLTEKRLTPEAPAYTYRNREDRYRFSLYDHLLICFPTDLEATYMVAEKAVMERSADEYISSANLNAAFEEITLEDCYEDLTGIAGAAAAFYDRITNHRRREEVVYTGNTPRINKSHPAGEVMGYSGGYVVAADSEVEDIRERAERDRALERIREWAGSGREISAEEAAANRRSIFSYQPEFDTD